MAKRSTKPKIIKELDYSEVFIDFEASKAKSRREYYDVHFDRYLARLNLSPEFQYPCISTFRSKLRQGERDLVNLEYLSSGKKRRLLLKFRPKPKPRRKPVKLEEPNIEPKIDPYNSTIVPMLRYPEPCLREIQTHPLVRCLRTGDSRIVPTSDFKDVFGLRPWKLRPLSLTDDQIDGLLPAINEFWQKPVFESQHLYLDSELQTQVDTTEIVKKAHQRIATQTPKVNTLQILDSELLSAVVSKWAASGVVDIALLIDSIKKALARAEQLAREAQALKEAKIRRQLQRQKLVARLQTALKKRRASKRMPELSLQILSHQRLSRLQLMDDDDLEFLELSIMYPEQDTF